MNSMSNRFERESERASEGRSSTSMMHLLGQMLMLPFTVFVYGMDMFVKTIKGIQHVADQGMDVMAGGTSQSVPGVQADMPRPTGQTTIGGRFPPPGPPPGEWGDLEVKTKTSTSVSTIGDAAEANQKEILKMADRNLSDDQLKLVRYKILFVKRDYEVAFGEREDLVYDNMTGEAFTAWKVAEFIQRLGHVVVPYSWRKKDYPRTFTTDEKDPAKKMDVFIERLGERDKKYLRVFYEVLERYVREEDEDDEVTVLKDIKKAIDRLPRMDGGVTSP
jgi:hypothetical protein